MSLIHHFIHLYFFTEFEVLFYIYYILPYEKQLVYKLFSIDKMLEDDAIITLFDNMNTDADTDTDTNKYNKQCRLEQDHLDKSNEKLWTYCFIYIISINILLFLCFIKDLAITYNGFYYSKDIKDIYNSKSSLVAFGSINNLTSNYKKTDNAHTLFEIEPIDLELNLDLNLNLERPGSPMKCKDISYNSFAVYYWNKSEFLIASYKTIQFVILIGIFEYLFFIFIVNKYKIVNAKILLCKLIQKI